MISSIKYMRSKRHSKRQPLQIYRLLCVAPRLGTATFEGEAEGDAPKPLMFSSTSKARSSTNPHEWFSKQHR